MTGPLKIADYFTVKNAELVSGTPPTASASPPTITVTGNGSTVSGGSSFVDVTSDATESGTPTLTEIYVAVTGADGYYKVTVPSVTSARLEVLYTRTIPSTMTLLVNAAANGGTSVQKSFAVTRLSTATDNLQVTLTWDQNSDLDLHLAEATPDGTTQVIYWGAPTSTHGGTLNLDSNGACAIDSVRNENIYYTSAPPDGTYTVKVDNWENCLWDDNAVPPQGREVHWIVTVRHGSDAPCTVSGTFPATDRGDGSVGGDSRDHGVTALTFPIPWNSSSCPTR